MGDASFYKKKKKTHNVYMSSPAFCSGCCAHAAAEIGSKPTAGLGMATYLGALHTQDISLVLSFPYTLGKTFAPVPEGSADGAHQLTTDYQRTVISGLRQ